MKSTLSSFLLAVGMACTIVGGMSCQTPTSDNPECICDPCPAFPDPSVEALEALRDLNDPMVDEWMVRLWKHRQKVKEMR